MDADTELLAAGCGYCGSFSASLELQCRQNVGDHRKVCVMALLKDLVELTGERGWHSTEQQWRHGDVAALRHSQGNDLEAAILTQS